MPCPVFMNRHVANQLNLSVQKLLKLHAIEKCEPTGDQFISSYFLREKQDHSHRFILNLKGLNIFIKKEHFKIEDIRTAINLLNRGDWMCKLDIKDAYLLIPIASEHKKYLRFIYQHQLYQFTALPFGLTSAPYIFTKVMKPLINWLRKLGIILVVYLDDFFIIGRSKSECSEHTIIVARLLIYLGFILNWEKSVLEPRRVCTFLGMNINSVNMTIELPEEKREKIKAMIEKLLESRKIRIKDLEKCIGVLVAACPAIAYSWLYYKNLECLKRQALTLNRGNTRSWISLSGEAREELGWWISQILTANNKIRPSTFDLEIFTDASSTGWGAYNGRCSAHGIWNASERELHINALEIKAATLGLKCFAKSLYNKQILLRVDNVTALAYINKMGGTKFESLNNLAKELWEWCIDRKLWVFAEYVASKENLADEGSRISNLDTEWELATQAYNEICERLGVPEIDLFASRINSKCKNYCSWDRDPEAYAINALTINWQSHRWYAFPPFSLIPKILKKIKDEGSSGILIVPLWTVQPWYPEFERLLVSKPIIFEPANNLLLSPCRKVIHPLASSLTLVAGIVSGRHSRKRTWRTT